MTDLITLLILTYYAILVYRANTSILAIPSLSWILASTQAYKLSLQVTDNFQKLTESMGRHIKQLGAN